MSRAFADRDDARGSASLTTSVVIACALSLAAGLTVAIILQDGSVVVPFLALPLLLAPAVHELRRLSPQMMWGFAAGATVVGGTGLLVGLFGPEDGTLQALGLLGGGATLAVAIVVAATLGITSLVSRRRHRPGTAAADR